MIRPDDLTPRQHRIGRRAARYPELRAGYLAANGIFLVNGLFLAFLAYRSHGLDPARFWQLVGAASVTLGAPLIAFLLGPTIDLLGLLYRELAGSGSLGTPAAAPLAAEGVGLAPREQRLVASARRLEGLGWGAIRGALLALVVSGFAVIAAALWRFGSEIDGLGAAVVGMAASGGLTVGVGLGGLALLRWMRLAASLGPPASEAAGPP